LQRAGLALLRGAGERVAGAAKLLDSLSYRRVLERGYAVIRDRDGRPLTRAAALSPALGVTLELADGSRDAVITGGDRDARPVGVRPRGRDRAPGEGGEQGSLL